jgi:hypothetical protein
MLRLCYKAYQLGQEKELFKNKWDIINDNGAILQQKEGLGLQCTISKYGLGWFLSKINWEAWDLLPTYARWMVFSNPQIKKVYQKRWQAVRLTIKGAVLIDEARMWARKFNVTST